MECAMGDSEQIQIGNVFISIVRPDKVIILDEWRCDAKVVSASDLAEVLSAWVRDKE